MGKVVESFRRLPVRTSGHRRRRAGDCLAFDTETTGLNRWTGDRPFALSVYWPNGEHRYWEWTVNPRTRMPRISVSDIRDVRSVLCDPDVRKYTFNGKFDCLMLGSVGIEVPLDTIEEVSFMARAVNNLEFSYMLKPLSKKYAGIPVDDETELKAAVIKARRLAKRLGYHVADDVESDYWMPRTLSQLHPREAREVGLDPDVCETYAVLDARRTITLGLMYEQAMDELDVRGTYEAEMELFPITMEMETRGVVVDEDRMAECRKTCEKMIGESNARLILASGNPEFNINSTKQLAKLLFGEGGMVPEKGKLPVLKRTKGGQPKTDAEALAPHRSNPLVQDVLRVRSNSQALKLFFNKYRRLAERDATDQLILHPGFKQWGTLTGRYSCSEPNLQQVSDPDTTSSIAAEFVVDVRQVFVPREGYCWYCPDYSQIEVILFADISGEVDLQNAIRNGQDIHGVTAEKVWGGEGNEMGRRIARLILDTDDDGLITEKLVECNYRITDLEKLVDKKIARKRAKAVTFTKIFGGGPLALMRWIGVTRPEAVEILGGYDRSFPNLVRRMREIELMGKRDGYVINPFGRRLCVDPWHAYRIINHVVQSAAADLIKGGMRRCAKYLRETRLDARILLTIHDELIFEIKRRHVSRPLISKIKELMSDHGGHIGLPVKVDVDRVTERWSDKTKVEI